MIAMFGIGFMELIVLAVVGLLFVGVPIGLVLVIVFALRKPQPGTSEYGKLLAENERLRREVDQLKRNAP